MSVTLFENRVFADVIKLSSGYIRVELNIMNDVLIRGKFGHRDIHREECNVKTEAEIEVMGLRG
jgi:hypothetical protein